MSDEIYDLCVIGGGVNGAGIARDAAGRGLSVLLLEKDDLAGATSSKSTKLIHGGLRYLEYFEFKLVRESLKERETLLSLAPHIIWPMDFILPHTPQQRPIWMIRLGLFLYDHLARRKKLKGSKKIILGAPLRPEYHSGFQYSDCWVDDSRLVVLNAMDAAERGATILTRTACTGLSCVDGVWQMQAGDQSFRASMVVNAAGPWVRDLIDRSGLGEGQKALPKVRLVKGSHIITKRLYDGEQAYILQQSDNRICFVIPYEGGYTLIGTTEEDYQGDPNEAGLSEIEMEYLLAAYNDFFAQGISKDDVLWSYSGVRPLFDDGEDDATSATRDFKIYAHQDLGAPIVSVFGGKLTTYRVLAEQVMNQLLHLDNRYAPPWTDRDVLPGGEMIDGDFEWFVQQKTRQYDWLPEGLVYRYARAYGFKMDVFLEGAKSEKDLGQHFGDGVYEAEIIYLLHYEFAKEAEDILWRRSKLGLHVRDATVEAVSGYIRTYRLRRAADG